MPAFRHRSSLSLDLATQQHVEVEIVSPTPRAFVFAPGSQARPSITTFQLEPDLEHRGWSPSPSEASSATTFSTSTFSTSSYTSSAASGKRRKSSAGLYESPASSTASGSRPPRKGDDDYVKRPENAFILFRRKCCEDRSAAATVNEDTASLPNKKQRQADLSKTISQQWKELSPAEKQHWEDLAKEKKREHEKLHPGYVYRPQRKSKKSSKRENEEDMEGSSTFMLQIEPLSAQATSRSIRSSSAPTPPPFPSSAIQPADFLPTSAPNGIATTAFASRENILQPAFEYEPNSSGLIYYTESQPETMHNFAMDRPLFAGRARSQSLQLCMPTYELQPNPQIFSPSSDCSSPASPADSPFTPLDTLTGPFSQISFASPDSATAPVWPVTEEPLGFMQATTNWSDFTLWEGAERFSMETALCEIGLPPDDTELPLGAEFLSPEGYEPFEDGPIFITNHEEEPSTSQNDQTTTFEYVHFNPNTDF